MWEIFLEFFLFRKLEIWKLFFSLLVETINVDFFLKNTKYFLIHTGEGRGEKVFLKKINVDFMVVSPNLVRIGCKTYVLHHPIRNYHINILLKIQYILSHLITSQ